MCFYFFYFTGVIFDNSSKSTFANLTNNSLELKRALTHALRLLNTERSTDIEITAEHVTYDIDVTDSFEVSNACKYSLYRHTLIN